MAGGSEDAAVAPAVVSDIGDTKGVADGSGERDPAYWRPENIERDGGDETSLHHALVSTPATAASVPGYEEERAQHVLQIRKIHLLPA